jgi:hypothetical protein
MPKGKAVAGRRRTRTDEPLRFDQRLALQQWILNLFGVVSIEKLAVPLKAPELERFDENNVSFFHHNLKLLFDRPELPQDLLLAYDQNIVRHWRRITERRNHTGPTLFPKYFQYLALLFAEIYLDRFFGDPDRLVKHLNEYVESFNRGDYSVGSLPGMPLPDVSRVEPFTKLDCNKLAFWMATGSGKTLLMHINILQYQHYLERSGRQAMNRVILLTPNEGLSQQHLDEFEMSGIPAKTFSKEGRGLYSGRAVEILDIHKLRDEMGEKTVAVDAFEGNNLVLVDEGHRGTSGAETGEWMKKRNQLCENGFSFEYSATFGQAMRASGNRPLETLYAKCILFDYSYKYFYGDGYGKDYRILNLADDTDQVIRQRYITACLLSFYQQLKLYQENTSAYRPYLLERPLWVFVGGSVNAVRTQNQRKVSDVVDILLFLSAFVKQQTQSIESINRLLAGRSGLLDAQGRELFQTSFQYLGSRGLTADQVFADILQVLFNAPASASLHVENLKGTDGEVALRLGENDPFGVISVGDASALCKLCGEQRELVVTEKVFSGSLFRKLNDDTSTISILIGSKKFTEGWSSWRVSTMGLMNIGRNEGPQIIQLFGRGVRLKGKGFGLKRSRHVDGTTGPKHIETLETLQIFGIRADYMRQFKEYLEKEGLPSNEDRVEFILPVVRNLGSQRLKMVRLQEGIEYKRTGPKPTLGKPPESLTRHPVVVNWYPKLQAMASSPGRANAAAAVLDECYFEAEHLAFLDFDRIYFELQQYKNEQSWHNLCLPRAVVPALLADKKWYRLLIPKEEMQFRSFRQVQRWQEIASTLIRRYADRFYKFRKQEYEGAHLEYRELTADDPNFIQEYRLLIEQSREDIVRKLHEIKGWMETGQLRNVDFQSICAIAFDRHLYEPLIYVDSDVVEVKPVVLDTESERDFVLDLQSFCQKRKDFLVGKELYLLRNLSRGRGMGFFEAGNFYPDFILWVVTAGRQYVSFVDPKGLRNLEGPDDPKIRFHRTIKELEQKLGDSGVILNSFIVAPTRIPSVSWWNGGMTQEEFEARNVVFQREDQQAYIGKILSKMLAG